MIRALLDVNVVLSLIDPRHVFHEAAHSWAETPAEWLLCPIVENGVIRVASHPRYSTALGSASVVRDVVRALRELPHERFVPADVTLADDVFTDVASLTTSRVTDLYLVALAVRHEAQLVTFDRKIAAGSMRGGAGAVVVLSA